MIGISARHLQRWSRRYELNGNGKPLPYDQFVFGIRGPTHRLSIQALKDDRPASRPIVLREIGYSSDERGTGLTQFGLQVISGAPSLGHDGGERCAAGLADRANGSAGAVVVGGRDEQSLTPNQGSEGVPRRSIPSHFSPPCILVDHAFLRHMGQNAPYSIEAPDYPQMSGRPSFHRLQQQDTVNSAAPMVPGILCKRFPTLVAHRIVVDTEIDGIRYGDIDCQCWDSRLAEHIGEHRCHTRMELIFNYEIHLLGNQPSHTLHSLLGTNTIVSYQKVDSRFQRSVTQ